MTPDQVRGRGDAMRIAGYAALFNVADAARDTIRPGAFARSLREYRGAIPLYWQHKPEQRIGWVRTASEDARGLRVVAEIDNPQGRAGQMLRQRAVDGLSFGYRARRYAHTPQGRVLEDIDLFEISLVTRPLQHGSRVHLIA